MHTQHTRDIILISTPIQDFTRLDQQTELPDHHPPQGELVFAFEQAMQENNKIYEKMVYPGADHAFHNDTGARYHAEAARDAWERTLAWFDQYVRNA